MEPTHPHREVTGIRTYNCSICPLSFSSPRLILDHLSQFHRSSRSIYIPERAPAAATSAPGPSTSSSSATGTAAAASSSGSQAGAAPPAAEEPEAPVEVLPAIPVTTSLILPSSSASLRPVLSRLHSDPIVLHHNHYQQPRSRESPLLRYLYRELAQGAIPVRRRDPVVSARRLLLSYLSSELGGQIKADRAHQGSIGDLASCESCCCLLRTADDVYVHQRYHQAMRSNRQQSGTKPATGPPPVHQEALSGETGDDVEGSAAADAAAAPS